MNKVLLISDSFILREGMKSLLKEKFKVNSVIEKNKLHEIYYNEVIDVDLIFLDIKKNDYLYLSGLMKNKKNINENVKIIVLDQNKDNDLFIKLVNEDINGYLFDIDDKDELIYKIKKVTNGNEHYDTDLLCNILVDVYEKEDDFLSKREKEIMNEIELGNKNKEIGNNLGISESTVKRHISNILSKLNLNNKYEIIEYMNNRNYISR